MMIVRTIKQLQRRLKRLGRGQHSLGFVPTMGYFHDGHISLMRRSVKQNSVTVVSVFVNPTQFGPREDLEKYPRDLQRDAALARGAGVDILFAPSVEEMYPTQEHFTAIDVPRVSAGLCGASRPGHFRGVATVVCKLLHIVGPDVMYLGQKDAQQVAVIQKMVSDLNIPVQVDVCPTAREVDGLAMSSRNIYLSPAERRSAPSLYKALKMGARLIAAGERDGNKIISKIKKLILEESSASIEYVSIVELAGFSPVRRIRRDILIAVAVKFGATRLIDNVIAKVHGQ